MRVLWLLLDDGHVSLQYAVLECSSGLLESSGVQALRMGIIILSASLDWAVVCAGVVPYRALLSEPPVKCPFVGCPGRHLLRFDCKLTDPMLPALRASSASRPAKLRAALSDCRRSPSLCSLGSSRPPIQKHHSLLRQLRACGAMACLVKSMGHRKRPIRLLRRDPMRTRND